MSGGASPTGPALVRAFLEEGHVAWAERTGAFASGRLRARPEAAGDGAARVEARELLGLLGREGMLEPIGALELRSCCLAREALAAASPLADAVWALQGLSVTPILTHGSDELRERFAAPALAGELMGAFAMTEPGAGSDVAAIATRARPDGGGYVLDGGKWLISNAGIADFYVVFASIDPDAGSRGLGAFVVAADAGGVVFEGAQVMAAPHPLGRVRFEGCRVEAGQRLGEEGDGFRIGMATLDRLRATVGAAACGMAARALEEALAHARERTQFGRPLADFQLVRERLGRMAVELSASRLLVYRAAWEKDRGAERVTVEAAMAKAYATEAAQRAVDDAIQILGGRGVLADHPLDRLYRSVRALRIYEGTTEIQHLIVAGKLIDEAREGRS